MAKVELQIPPLFDGAACHRSFHGTCQCPLHHHDELELNLVRSGRAVYLVDNCRYVLRPNMLVWLFPEQEHLLLEPSSDCTMWIVVFKPAMVQRVCRKTPYECLGEPRPQGRFIKQLQLATAQSLEAILLACQGAEQDQTRFNAAITHLLIESWDAHLNAQSVEPDMDVHPAVERAAFLIYRGQDKPGLDQLAQQCHLSTCRLSRLFKQQMGLSLARYRQQCHLDRFFQIYAGGHRYHLLQAALKAGFGSYAQFYRVFQEHMGCSPQVYRRSLKK